MYSNTIRVDSNLEAHIVASIVVCIGMYWFVLICMSTYLLVFGHKLIVNTPTWGHTALEFTFNAIFYCWYGSNELEFRFSVCRMVRGKDHCPRIDVVQCASSPRLIHVVTFTPRIAHIHPTVHAVRNCASITSWYQRQASQEAGHWHNPDPWTWPRLIQHLCSRACLGCTGPPRLCFTWAIVPKCIHHSTVTLDQRPIIPLYAHPEQQCHSSIPAFINWSAKHGPFACVVLWWGNEECKILQDAQGVGSGGCALPWNTYHYMLNINQNMPIHV